MVADAWYFVCTYNVLPRVTPIFQINDTLQHYTTIFSKFKSCYRALSEVKDFRDKTEERLKNSEVVFQDFADMNVCYIVL